MPEVDEPVNLLALDGGGIRGVSELIILDRIMRRIKVINNLETVPKPCEFFDLIAGTSTGGLVAIMLGRLQMSTEQALAVYDTFSEKVFSSKNKTSALLVPRKGNRFKATGLRKAIEELVEREGKGDGLLDPTEPEKGRMFVCARPTGGKNGSYTRFRSYEIPDSETKIPYSETKDCKIWEAARATSAAPLYFKAMTIEVNGKPESYVDAALGCNNPLNELLHEAADLFGRKRRIGCIVSLGTGTKELPIDLGRPTGVFNTIGWAVRVITVLKELAVDTEKDSHEIQERFKGFKGTVFRFNVTGGADNIRLSSYDKIGELKKRTRTYLSESSIKEDIKEVAERLGGRKISSGLSIGHVCLLDEDQIVTTNGSAKLRGFVSPHFVGRESILETLDHYFSYREPESARPRRPLLLYGMGGSGKSQIARKFIDMCHDRFPYTFWIDATSKVTILESYAEIAKHIFPAVDAIKATAWEVMRWFDKSDHDFFLVVDNWSSEHSLLDLPGSDKGNYLFTSRQNNIEYLQSRLTISVGQLDEEEAAALLLRSAEEEVDTLELWDAAKEIVRELGCLPLAVDQAGAYIASPYGSHLTDYLAVFRGRRKEILGQPQFKGGTAEPITVYATFDLSYRQLVELSKKQKSSSRTMAARSALLILNVVCFYHNEGITKTTFHRAALDRLGTKNEEHFPLPVGKGSPGELIRVDEEGNWDAEPIDLGFSLLEEMSIFRRTSRETWSLHILLQSWAKDRMDLDTRARLALYSRAVLFESIGRTKTNDDIIYRRAIRPHLEACKEILPLKSTVKLSKGYALYFGADSTDHIQPQKTASAESNSPARYLPWNNDQLESEYWFRLGLVYRENQMFDAAEMCFRESVQGKQLVFGYESVEVFDALGRLADICAIEGKIWDEYQLTRELLERVEGWHSQWMPQDDASHTWLIDAKREWVNTLLSHSDMKEAEEYMEQMKEAKQRYRVIDPLQDAEDDMTFWRMKSVEAQNKDTATTEQLYQARLKVLEIHETKLGKDHHNTLSARADVAGSLRDLGRNLEALKIYGEVFEARSEIFGRSSPLTLSTLLSYLDVLRRHNLKTNAPQEAFDEMVDMAYRLYEFTLGLRGKEDPQTVDFLATLSGMLSLQGDMANAVVAMKRAARRTARIYGSEHQRTKNLLKAVEGFSEDLDVTVESMARTRGQQIVEAAQREEWEALTLVQYY